ncbi:hypothetical protein [Nocardia gipuzkoensis]
MSQDIAVWRRLYDVFARIAGAFGRAEPRGWARAYVTGLSAPVERKNSWQPAEAAGAVSPDGCQHLLNRACRRAAEQRPDPVAVGCLLSEPRGDYRGR